MLCHQPPRQFHRRDGEVELQQKIEGAQRRRRTAEAGDRLELVIDEPARPGDLCKLVLNGSAPLRHGGNGGVLRYHGRANEVGVLNLDHAPEEVLGDDHPADAPTGEAVGLRQGEKLDRVGVAVCDAARAERTRPIPGEVFVSFIVDVIDAGLAAQSVDCADCLFGVYGTGGVVRRDRNDGTRALCDGGADGGDPRLVILIGGHAHRAAAAYGNGHLVVEVVGREQNDLVAWVRNGGHGIHEAHIGAGSDDNSCVGVRVDTVFGRKLGGNGAAQLRNALHRFVDMVGRIGKAAAHRFANAGRRTVIDHTLAEGNGSGVFADPTRDDWDNGRLHALQTLAASAFGFTRVAVHAVAPSQNLTKRRA